MAKADREAMLTLERRRAWIIGLALLCCYSYFFYLGGNWNIESRHAQIVAMAEDHTLAIDPYHGWTGDEAFYRGHYYSDKLIGPSLAAIPFYWTGRRLLIHSGIDPKLALMLGLRIANVLTNALPSALLGALLYLFLAQLGLTPQLRIWLTFAYALGTLAFPYSTALFGHQLAAVAVAAALMLLWRQRQQWSNLRAVAAGALAGFAAISDAMGIFIAPLLGLYAIWLAQSKGKENNRSPQRGSPTGILAFAAAALAVFSIQLAANWSSFGSPLTFPHIYHVQASFRARHTAGLFGIHPPQLYPLYQLTFGSWRGLFRGSPVLLFALPGFFLMARRWRAEAALCAATWLVVLLANSGYENWTTGSAYGPRYQIVTLPLLIIAAAPAAERWPGVSKLLTAISIAFTAIVTAQSPFMPEALRTPLSSAIAQFAHGNLLHGNLGMVIGLEGIASLLPLVAVVAAFLLALRMVREA